MEKKCVNCQEVVLKKYKCRKCKQPYCGLNCFKEHDKQHMKVVEVDTQQEEQEQQTSIKQEQLQLTEIKKEYISDIKKEIDEELVLSQSQLSTLTKCDEIKKRIGKFKQYIKTINRSKNKIKQLSLYQNNDESFKDFTYLLLKQLGFLDDQNRFIKQQE